MNRVKAIILCLMLALPLHGMTAALMVCKAFQSSAPHATPHSAHTAANHGHAHLHDLAEEAGRQTDNKHIAGEAQTHFCNVCASCSASTCAMLIADYRMPAAAPATDFISYTAFHIPAVDPERPDDPPRA